MANQFKINPNINTTSLLERYYDTLKMAESRLIDPLVGKNDFDQVTIKSGEFYVQSAYTAIYAKLTNEMNTQIKVLDAVRPFYLTEVILNQITEDALAPMVGSEGIFRFSHKDPNVQKELDDLTDRLNLNQLIQNITPDLCFYGEYTLETKIDENKEVKEENTLTGKPMVKKGRGLIELKDKVDHATVVSLSRDGKEIGFLNRDRFSGRIMFQHPSDFVKFSLGGSRVRVQLDSWVPESKALHNKALGEIIDAIPRFLRIGKSVLWGMTGKLRELELLEKLVPATKINKLSQGNIIGIGLPETYDLKSGMTVARELEQMINKKVNVDPQTGEITAEAILSIAGRTRVVPMFGDKGDISKLDTKSEDVDDITSQTKELRELILDSIGVPSELIYKHDGDGAKNETLKRYSKYLRKLKRVQKAIAEGLKQVAFIHLDNVGMKYDEKEIDVLFLNALIEIDNLDRLEYAEATINMIGNIKNFFGDLAAEDSPYRDMIQLEKVAEFIDANLKLVGLADAIKLRKEGGPGIAKKEPDTSLDDLGLEDDETPTDSDGPDIQKDGEPEIGIDIEDDETDEV